MRGGRRTGRAAAALGQLALPSGRLSFEDLLRLVEATLRRQVTLIPVDTRHVACGSYVQFGDRDLVHYAEGTTALHQQHIICHEFAHILLGHRGATVTDGTRAALFPDLAAGTIVRMLKRTTYEDSQERDAEQLGTLLALRLEAGSRRLPTRQELALDPAASFLLATGEAES